MTTNKPRSFEPLVGQARNAKRMHMEMQCDPQWVLTLAEERDQLRAECEQLRKDAGRYRWLRERVYGPGPTGAYVGIWSEETSRYLDTFKNQADVDAAINAAIQADKP